MIHTHTAHLAKYMHLSIQLCPLPQQFTGHWPSYTLPAIFIPLKPHWNHSSTVNTFPSLCVPCPFITPTEEKPQPRMNPPICPRLAMVASMHSWRTELAYKLDSASFLRHWVHRLHQIGTVDHPTPTLPTCLLLRLHLPPPSELLEVNAHFCLDSGLYPAHICRGLCNYVFCSISKRPDTGFPRSRCVSWILHPSCSST